jgi:hypothetical protein
LSEDYVEREFTEVRRKIELEYDLVFKTLNKKVQEAEGKALLRLKA